MNVARPLMFRMFGLRAMLLSRGLLSSDLVTGEGCLTIDVQIIIASTKIRGQQAKMLCRHLYPVFDSQVVGHWLQWIV